MNYSSALLQELAAAHALGTLRGRARARFTRLCDELPAADAARRYWEDRLLPLALAVPAQRVAALGWSTIRLRLEELMPSRGATTHAEHPVRVPRWLAAACIAGLALLSGQLLLQGRPDWRPVATLTPPNGVAQWRIARSADFRRLRVETLGEVPAPAGRSYELWVVPADGSRAVSLGIMSAEGEQERLLDERQQQLLMTARNVAVSLEAGGGAPNGLATEVLFAAPIEGTG